MWVALLADPVHSAVGVDAQEEAPVLAVQPLGVLEVAGRESAAAAVLRQGWQRGDAPGGHGPTKFQCWFRTCKEERQLLDKFSTEYQVLCFRDLKRS